jgi:hypothetical protein
MKTTTGFKLLLFCSVIGSVGWLVLGTYYLVFFQFVALMIKQTTHYTDPLEMVPVIDQVAAYIRRIDDLIDWMLYRNWLILLNAILVICSCIWMFFLQKVAWYLYWSSQMILALSAIMVMYYAAEFPFISASTTFSCFFIVGNNVVFSLVYAYYFRLYFQKKKRAL